MTPISACQGLQNLQPSGDLVDDGFGVRTKREHRIKGHPQDFGILGQGNEGTVEEDLWMVVDLMRICCEKRHCRLLRGKFKLLASRPVRDLSEVVIHSILQLGYVSPNCRWEFHPLYASTWWERPDQQWSAKDGKLSSPTIQSFRRVEVARGVVSRLIRGGHTTFFQKLG